MYKVNYVDVTPAPVNDEGTKGVQIRWLINESQGADNFAFRVFTLESGGNTPLHTHVWEHEVFILKGEGVVVSAGTDNPIKPGDTIFVPGEEEHQFKNTGDSELEFICIIPIVKTCGC